MFLPGSFDRYADYSRRLHEVLLSFTPLVEGIALDEAFLDVGGARRLLGTAPEIGTAIRRRIADDLRLNASVGVATCKLIAKLASEAAKPTASPSGAVPGPGVLVVEPGEEIAFLHPHPVQALWGVGPATRTKLDRFGVRTVGDLAALPVETLVNALGRSLGRHLHDLAWARDDRPVEPDRAVKSIGHEETFGQDLFDVDRLHVQVVRQCDAVATRLRRAGVAGRTVTLKVRFGDFRTITRSRTVPRPLSAGPGLARVAAELLDGVDCGPGVRLVGVSVSNLAEPEAEQLRLDDAIALGEDAEAPGDTQVASAVEQVRLRFGDTAVRPAALVGRNGLRLKRTGDQQWGPSPPDDKRVVDAPPLCEDGREREPGA